MAYFINGIVCYIEEKLQLFSVLFLAFISYFNVWFSRSSKVLGVARIIIFKI
jgi:hypothetical protein